MKRTTFRAASAAVSGVMIAALVPLTAMPGWMSVLAQFNPMTWAIDAVRPLILTNWGDALPHVGMAVVVMLIFDALCLYGGAKAFRRAMG